MTAAASDHALLDVVGLTKLFDVSASLVARMIERRRREVLTAVADVSFAIAEGSTFGLVGESGCGKSTLARMIAGLVPPTSGAIRYRGQPLRGIDTAADRHRRREIQMVFQDPVASLNPRWRAGRTIGDPAEAFGLSRSREETKARVAALLEEVGLDRADGRKYPHQFSGGQRQRIAIARALAAEPRFLICDEPTSALDVSVQAQVLNLMRSLQQRHRLSLLFISHNLAVIEHMADRVGVMYLGRLVEEREKTAFFREPKHPYSALLLKTVPTLASIGRPQAPLPGEVPTAIRPPSGCAFHPRCPIAFERCRRERPSRIPVPGGTAACHALL